MQFLFLGVTPIFFSKDPVVTTGLVLVNESVALQIHTTLEGVIEIQKLFVRWQHFKWISRDLEHFVLSGT